MTAFLWAAGVGQACHQLCKITDSISVSQSHPSNLLARGLPDRTDWDWKAILSPPSSLL